MEREKGGSSKDQSAGGQGDSMSTTPLQGGGAVSNEAWQWIRRALTASSAALAMFFAAAAVPASSAAALPTLTEIPATSGTHGYPYDAVPETPAIAGAPFINLAAVGYAQQ